MTVFFLDYYWKEGKPVGRQAVTLEEASALKIVSYKIVIDPYYKRISVECYLEGKWHSVVYDSFLLDFRKLNERDQLAWQKEVLSSSNDGNEVSCLIRDQEDRVVVLEKHQLKNGVPISCKIFSPHGVLVASQEMHYLSWGGAFNGVILLDTSGRVVLKKTYAFDEESFQFTDLLGVG